MKLLTITLLLLMFACGGSSSTTTSTEPKDAAFDKMEVEDVSNEQTIFLIKEYVVKLTDSDNNLIYHGPLKYAYRKLGNVDIPYLRMDVYLNKGKDFGWHYDLKYKKGKFIEIIKK